MAKQKTKRRGPKSKPKRSRANDAPVSRASKPIRSTGKGNTRQSGVDHVATVDTGKVETGAIITRIQILPSLCRRLSELAGAFQRIRYRRLHFRIEPMGGTSVTGGYAAAFIRDPSDLLSPEDALSTIMAQKGALSRKAWEGANLLFTSGQRFYTSANSELRTFSPGELVICCAATFSQPVQFVINLNWTVDLEDPGLQDDGAVDIPRIAHVKAGYVLGLHNGHSGLWGHNRKNSEWTYNMKTVIDYPFPEPSTVDEKTVIRFRAPFSIVYEEKEDAEYAFRDILCMISGGLWISYPVESDASASEYYDSKSVHGVPWLTPADEFLVIGNDGLAVSNEPTTVFIDSGEVQAVTSVADPVTPSTSPVVMSHWHQNRSERSQALRAAQALLSKNLSQSKIYSALGFQVLSTLTTPKSKPSDAVTVTPPKPAT